MKIFLLSDYFYPFTPGGAEWSVYELAKALKQNQIEPILVTLNYGTKDEETFKGLKVFRMPFGKKLTGQRRTINPIWQNNPVFFLVSAYHLYKLAKKLKPKMLHSHGKFLIPATIIVGAITNIPVVITLRDKQILCPLGKCFFEKGRFKACNFFQYLTSDLPWFFKNYKGNKNLLTFCYFSLGAIYNRLMFFAVKLLARSASIIIAPSQSHKKYLEANGFSRVKVMYNTATFLLPRIKINESKSILFAGKLSKGKGGELLTKVAGDLIKKNKIRFIFAGTIEIKKMFNRQLGVNPLKNYVKILPNVNQQKLLSLYTQVSATVVPSIYPESFGRVALESISRGTPAIVTDIGGLAEIVEDKVTGRIVNADDASLKEAILDVAANEEFYKNNIKKRFNFIKKKFHDGPIKQHLNTYRSLIK